MPIPRTTELKKGTNKVTLVTEPAPGENQNDVDYRHGVEVQAFEALGYEVLE